MHMLKARHCSDSLQAFVRAAALASPDLWFYNCIIAQVVQQDRVAELKAEVAFLRQQVEMLDGQLQGAHASARMRATLAHC